MLQLTYISTSREPITPAMLSDILDASRRNNARVGVTGLLVSGGRRFLQALEGPDAAVLASYARIQADPRHFACVVLSSKKVDAPAFGAWSMAHQMGGSQTGGEDLKSIIAQIVEPLEDRTLRAHFTGFADVHARAA